MNEQIEQLAKIFSQSEKIVFFGGAGVSTASGIPDFRSSDGLYSRKLGKHFTPEEAVSHTFLMRHPDEFFDFYKKNLVYPDVEPNDAHKALAELEQMGKLTGVVTQNIDGLHQKAGSRKVFELHGSVLRNYCTGCGKKYDVNFVLSADGIPYCPDCGKMVRPDVVLYEEGLDEYVIGNAVRAICDADTMIIGGTSLIVYPAAGLIRYFRGKNLVLINKSKTSADKKADLVIHDDIAMVMREALALMKQNN